MQDNGSQGGSEDDGAQMARIQEQKAAQSRILCGYIILSLLVSAAFYGLTIFQNPKLLPTKPE